MVKLNLWRRSTYILCSKIDTTEISVFVFGQNLIIVLINYDI